MFVQLTLKTYIYEKLSYIKYDKGYCWILRRYREENRETFSSWHFITLYTFSTARVEFFMWCTELMIMSYALRLGKFV